MGLAYERHGSGPALVLLHGVGHRRQAWQPVLDLLTPHRTVLTVDLPGHGESPPLRAAGRPAARAMAEEIFALFDELGLDRPHVAGNSLGGRPRAARGRAGPRGDRHRAVSGRLLGETVAARLRPGGGSGR